jgi:hypothetical protein
MFKSQNFIKAEPYFFIGILLIYLWPILSCNPFPSIDGPAHLYNANIISTLLKSTLTPINQLFEFNTFPEPNWSGHAVLCFFLQFLPPLMAQQLLLLIILSTTAIGYRKLFVKIDNNNQFLSWIIFPFLYNIFFCLGFYNFSIGLAILPFLLCWWMDHKTKPLQLKRIFQGFLFICIIYFSHLVVFLLAGLFMLVFSFHDLTKKNKNTFFHQLLFLAIVFLPGVILTIYYLVVFGTDGFHGHIDYIPKLELLKDISHGRTFIIYNFDQELKITRWIPIILLIISIVGFNKRPKNNYQPVFLTLLIISFLLIFIIPNSMASGGFLSIRTIGFFFLMWFLWIGTLAIKTIPKTILVVALLSVGFYQLFNHQKSRMQVSLQTKYILNSVDVLKENTTLLPLNYSNNWLQLNIVSYLGTLKNIAILDNYEASYKRFPIHWKKNMNPELYIGNFVTSNKPYINIKIFEQSTGIKVDYISRLYPPKNPKDSSTLDAIKQLNEGYRLIYNQNNFEVYERK